MKYLILVIFLFYFSSVEGQMHDNIWLVTGSNSVSPSTKLDFTNGFPSVDTTYRNLPITETNLMLSDSIGNLIFYSNGIKIYNANYQLMDNGDSLNPGQVANASPTGYLYTENMTSIPHPTQANKYYIFHQGVSYSSVAAGFSEKLYYTLVDMNANGGLGKVEEKNQVLLENDSILIGQLEVVKHGNGRDWWLVQPMAWSNGYHIFLIANNTITYHKQYVGNVHTGETEWLGQAIFSYQGDKYFRYDYKNNLDVFDFDRCTGYLSNYQYIPIQDSVDNVVNGAFYTGVAISPNDRYLYISSWIYLYQFDLWASNIPNSKDTVGVYDNYMHGVWQTPFSLLQSAPNGKIYSVVRNTPYFHIIDNPDIGGLGCNVIQRGLQVLPNNTYIPSFPHYRTPALSGSACDTITNTKTVEIIEKEVQIYPNPTSNLVYIEATQEIEQLSIHDALGREVYWYHQPRQQGITLDTQQWENGIYYVSIWLDGKIVQEKIQVLR